MPFWRKLSFVHPGVTQFELVFLRRRILIPPVSGEFSRAGGGEDGLAEAFQQSRNPRQTLLARRYLPQQ